MPDPNVQVTQAADHDRYVATDHLVWFDEPDDRTTEEQLEGVPPDQRFAGRPTGSDPDTYPASTAYARCSCRCRRRPAAGWCRWPASPGSASTPTTGGAGC